MINIKRVALSELMALVSTAEYANWDVIPISLHRAKSYVHNPRASSTDIVLYLAYIDDKLVGYRTIMPDLIFTEKGATKVGWLSGNWVNPLLRRKGVASQLFSAAYADWNGCLAFTNYALESKAVYDKTKNFTKVYSIQGQRFYIRPCFSQILVKRSSLFKKIKPFLTLTDSLLSVFNPLPIIARCINLNGFSFEYLSTPDEDVKNLFEELTKETPTQRKTNDLAWILNYPWLVSSPLGDRVGQKYFFSSSPKQFTCILIKVYEQKKPVGFIMMNLTDGFITTPYICCSDKDAKIFAKILVKHASVLGAKRLTTYHDKVSKEIKGLAPFGWFSISQTRNYFATQKVTQTLSVKNINFLEGDGDCAFV
jgi:GNAT superfamily N-acetyltransferase